MKTLHFLPVPVLLESPCARSLSPASLARLLALNLAQSLRPLWYLNRRVVCIFSRTPRREADRQTDRRGGSKDRS